MIKKILSLLFSREENLKIEKIFFRENELCCKVRDYVSINPFILPVRKLLQQDNLIAKFRRRDLLKLQEVIDKIPNDGYVKLIETFPNENKYKISYHDQQFVMDGQDICKDFKLL